MEIVRLKLSPDDERPPDTRYNDDTDTVETSVDGVNWTPNPGADPRSNPAYQLPALTSNARCAAAEGMRQEIAAWVLAAVGATSVIGLANVALTGALALIPVSWMFLMFWGIANSVLLIGSVTIGNAFTPEVLDEIKCILFCNLNPQGRLTAASLANARSQIAVQINDPVVTACFDLMIQSWGYVGFNNAGVLRGDPEAECECDTCEWCYVFDFLTSPGGWSTWTGGAEFNNRPMGTWVSGQGWLSTFYNDAGGNGVYIKHAVPENTGITYVKTEGVASRSGNVGLYLQGNVFIPGTGGEGIGAGGFIKEFAPDNLTNVIAMLHFVDDVPPTSTIFVTRITVRGTGVNPFGEDNC